MSEIPRFDEQGEQPSTAERAEEASAQSTAPQQASPAQNSAETREGVAAPGADRPMAEAASSADSSSARPRWQPLGAIERRVVGVLAEKAKTVPDSYPMSVNAICTGCNQKNNRDPVMQLEPDDVEAALERLRAIGAVGMVEGYGRVTKYRHYLYEWLGVDKVELAVMTELLLRGPQTLGELRARASRMEPIADLAALRAVCESLKRKGLVVYLTPEGRGQICSHTLYPPREMENLRTRYAAARGGAPEDDATPAAEGSLSVTSGQFMAYAEQSHTGGVTGAELQKQVAELSTAVAQLREQLSDLCQRVAKLEGDVQ